MSNFDVDISILRNAGQDLYSQKEDLHNIERSLQGSSDVLQYFSDMEEVIRSADTVIFNLRKSMRAMENLADVLQQTARMYQETEEDIAGRGSGSAQGGRRDTGSIHPHPEPFHPFPFPHLRIVPLPELFRGLLFPVPRNRMRSPLYMLLVGTTGNYVDHGRRNQFLARIHRRGKDKNGWIPPAMLHAGSSIPSGRK